MVEPNVVPKVSVMKKKKSSTTEEKPEALQDNREIAESGDRRFVVGCYGSALDPDDVFGNGPLALATTFRPPYKARVMKSRYEHTSACNSENCHW